MELEHSWSKAGEIRKYFISRQHLALLKSHYVIPPFKIKNMECDVAGQCTFQERKVVMSEDDGAALQKDLDNLSSWSAASGLAFNDKKCKLQTITRKHKPICTSYEVNGSTIKSCEVERDLGVFLGL